MKKKKKLYACQKYGKHNAAFLADGVALKSNPYSAIFELSDRFHQIAHLTYWTRTMQSID